jgi:hypothetical protein
MARYDVRSDQYRSLGWCAKLGGAERRTPATNAHETRLANRAARDARMEAIISQYVKPKRAL